MSVTYQQLVESPGRRDLICSECKSEVEPEVCSQCDGEGGWRSNSPDDGYAWNSCEHCYEGYNYQCSNEECIVIGNLEPEDMELPDEVAK